MASKTIIMYLSLLSNLSNLITPKTDAVLLRPMIGKKLQVFNDIISKNRQNVEKIMAYSRPSISGYI